MHAAKLAWEAGGACGPSATDQDKHEAAGEDQRRVQTASGGAEGFQKAHRSPRVKPA